jgi:hypothetical protein
MSKRTLGAFLFVLAFVIAAYGQETTPTTPPTTTTTDTTPRSVAVAVAEHDGGGV